LKSIRNMPFRLPTIVTQVEIANRAAEIDKVLNAILKNRCDFIKINNSIISQVF